MSVEDLRARLERHEPLTVVDIRDAEEHAEWRVPGSIHADVYDRIVARDPAAFDGVPLPAGAPVAVICWAGNTSRLAQQTLAARGIDARSVEGGMRAWSLAWNVAEVAPDLIQVRRTGKGCLSYMLASSGECAVVDPSLPSDVYLGLAAARGWRIAHVLDTHVHADHLSRARDLAQRAGATHHAPRTTRLRFEGAHALGEGDEVRVGKETLRVLASPGHTAEGLCYQWGDVLLSGDTLFLDSIGRPDLEASPEETRARAASLHRTLQRLLALPPGTVVLPCHVSAPIEFDGKALAARLSDVAARVPLARLGEAAFVEAILQRIPATPPNHKQIVQLNEAGTLPPGDVTALEAGANRCAIS